MGIDGTDNRYISNLGIDLETSGGLVWTKSRTSAYYHNLQELLEVQVLKVCILTQQMQKMVVVTNNTYIHSFEANGWTKNGLTGLGLGLIEVAMTM